MFCLVGASFTRFQTLRLQRVFPEVLQNCLISYGSCQFPTLGFVVERYKAVQNFIPEKFWKIKGSNNDFQLLYIYRNDSVLNHLVYLQSLTVSKK